MVGMMEGDQYCLRWNSYETNILATFEGLLDTEVLSDVTLFCEGNSALNLPCFAKDRACNSESETERHPVCCVRAFQYLEELQSGSRFGNAMSQRPGI